eukprot:TCONS_00009667-protein
MEKLLIAFAICLAIQGYTCTTQTCSGYDASKDQYYCEYREGDAASKIIINAPHGGGLVPNSIPNRSKGCWDSTAEECIWRHDCGLESDNCKAKVFRDGWTKPIAIELAEEIRQLTGQRPHLIINNLKRIKMDGNRERNQACFGVPEAETAYDEYHSFIAKAKNDHFANRRGLFIDVHGQVHSHGMIELGYQVLSRRLNEDDLEERFSSLHYAADHLPDGFTFDQILRGNKSIGWYLQEKGYPTIPSPAHPAPNGLPYFIGGYNTERYGSKRGGMVDGVQVEIHSQYRTSNTAVRSDFVKALAKSVVEYMEDGQY